MQRNLTPDVVTSTLSSKKDLRRILVVANETCGTAALCGEVARRVAGGGADVLLISPALTRTRLEYWTSDVDRATEEARGRLDRSLSSLGDLGVRARGDVGDPDPLQAIADALHSFRATEIVVYSHPAERANWLERDLVRKARDRFGVPVEDIVIEPSASEEARATTVNPPTKEERP